jgi:hypothetical protein
MADQTDTEEDQRTAEEELEETTQEESIDDDIVLDIDSATESETRVDQLQETVEQQSEEIDELQGLLMDLSTRVADDGGMGVCTDCHGPVVKQKRWFGSTTIECQRCGRVYHEY